MNQTQHSTSPWIAAGLCLALAGCGSPGRSPATSRDLPQIRESGVLYWGSDAAGGAPYEFADKDNPDKLVGFEVEIADEIAKKLGVKIEFRQTDWASLVPALNRGDFDMAMAGLEITEDRKGVVAFTRPYYIYTQQLMVRTEDTTTSSLDDLKGKRVGTLSNSAAERVLAEYPDVQTVSYDDNVRPYDDLEIGRVDGVLLDLPIVMYHGLHREKLRLAGEPFAPGEYAIAVRNSAPELKKALDEAIGEMIADGTLQRIYEKWRLWNEAQSAL